MRFGTFSNANLPTFCTIFPPNGEVILKECIYVSLQLKTVHLLFNFYSACVSYVPLSTGHAGGCSERAESAESAKSSESTGIFATFVEKP